MSFRKKPKTESNLVAHQDISKFIQGQQVASDEIEQAMYIQIEM